MTTETGILFDGREYTPDTAGAFIEIKYDDDDPVLPYLAVTPRETERFMTPTGARRWYARQTGLPLGLVVIKNGKHQGSKET